MKIPSNWRWRNRSEKQEYIAKIIIRKQIKLEAETGPKMSVRTLGQMYLLLSSFLRPRECVLAHKSWWEQGQEWKVWHSKHSLRAVETSEKKPALQNRSKPEGLSSGFNWHWAQNHIPMLPFFLSHLFSTFIGGYHLKTFSFWFKTCLQLTTWGCLNFWQLWLQAFSSTLNFLWSQHLEDQRTRSSRSSSATVLKHKSPNNCQEPNWMITGVPPTCWESKVLPQNHSWQPSVSISLYFCYIHPRGASVLNLGARS